MIKKAVILFIIISFFIGNNSVFATISEKNSVYQFVVLSTTDMHGRSTIKDVSSGKIEPNNMCKVATIVKNERKKYKNKILLIDNGDTIQGTLVAQYAITAKKNLENPMMTAMKHINYDVWVMGNHEFNYSPEQRNTQVRKALKSNIAVLGGNIVLKNDGKNIHDIFVEKGSPFYAPFFIREYKFDNKNKLKVAVIGLGNAANETWDKSCNYPNLQFSSLDNPQGLLENEINKWANYIKEENLADIIIVSVHSGKNTDYCTNINKFLLESQAISGTKNSKNIDLLIYGHDHQANIEKVTNADNKEIFIVNGGGINVTKNVFAVTFDKNGKYKSHTVNAELIELSKEKNDILLAQKTNKWYKQTYKWASEPLGILTGGWDKITNEIENKTNNDLLLNQTSFIDFIHKVQISATWQNYKKTGEKGAIVSLASPVASTNKNGFISYIPKDNKTLSILELSMIYRFGNNTLCTVDMNSKQLYSWLNTVANKYTLDSQGKAILKSTEAAHGTDTFYGIDYTLDITKPENQRIISAKINGINLQDIKEPIRIVLNNFRLAGSHGFSQATNFKEKDCIWQSTDDFSEEEASIQALLGKYVKSKEKISPKDTIE